MKKDLFLITEKFFNILFVCAFACVGILTLLAMISTMFWMNTL